MKDTSIGPFTAAALACFPIASHAQVNSMFSVPVLSEFGLIAMVIAVVSLAGWIINRRKK